MRSEKREKMILFLGLMVFLCFTLLEPISANAKETLTIGLGAPLSGRAADYGRMQKEGAVLAVEEINAKGGIKGRAFELVAEDDKNDPKESANVAKKFAADENIKVVIGHLSSPTSFAAAPIYERAKLPNIISLASNPDLPKQGTYIFQNTTTQEVESPSAARYIIKNLGKKNIAFVYINDDWGNSVKAYFPKSVDELGGKLVATEAYTPGEVDFRNLLKKIQNTKPDVFYGAYYAAEAAQLVMQAKELKVNFPILLSGGAMTYAFIKLAGETGEGVVFTSSFHPEDPDPFIQEFVKRFKIKFNNESPTMYSALVYDSVYLIAETVKNITGKVTRDSIRDGLANLKNVKTLCGTVTPNQYRQFVPRKMVMVIVKDGNFKFYTEIK